MADWPTRRPADAFAPIADREHHRLEVYLEKGQVVDARLDGESFWPDWFKIEFKRDGEVSAKVRGVKLLTRLGDEVVFHSR